MSKLKAIEEKSKPTFTKGMSGNVPQHLGGEKVWPAAKKFRRGGVAKGVVVGAAGALAVNKALQMRRAHKNKKSKS
jgi:hypothetical protein